jgi:hypothetical protein
LPTTRAGTPAGTTRALGTPPDLRLKPRA